MITYGFFNSINSDRTYNADQMSQYFKGLVSDGVYENVGGKFQVVEAESMTVNVLSGRAIIDSKWVENDNAETVDITAAHAILNRWTAVVLRLDIPNRLIEIRTIDGTPASTPTQPVITNTATIKEICLAMVYVAAGAVAITQADITDMRGSSLCGWVTGLITQVDTSTLWAQWQSAYSQYYYNMKAEFEAWFADLTEQLNIDTYVRQFKKHAVLDGTDTYVLLNMDLYTYDSSDIINVYINGLYAENNVDYTLSVSGDSARVEGLPAVAGTVIDIQVFRSQIGFYLAETDPGEGLEASSNAGIRA